MRATHRNRRQLVRVMVIAMCLALSALPVHAAGRAWLHATLLRSTPAANSHLTQPPDTIRLLFSEAVVSELSQISLTRPDGTTAALVAGLGPHDVHTLLAGVPPLPGGSYRVVWRAISADGHPVDGNFIFFIDTGADSSMTPGSAIAPIAPPEGNVGPAAASGNSIAPPSPMAMKDEPSAVAVSLLRGLGLGAMMSGIGLLFFGAAAGSRRNLDPEKLVVRLITIGSLLLVAHMVAWLYHISPTNGVSGEVLAKTLDSRIGRIEAIRVMLALLTLWALALAGRKSLALFFGVACLLISGAVGHSAGIDPQWAVPAKMVHLLSGSVWLGGLLWLLWTFRRDVTAFRIEARRVSGAALIAIIGVFASGVAQTYLFLNSPWDLVHSSYGRLVLAKMAGLLLLVAYGAQNRFRLIPRLDDARVGKRLSRSVAQEITIMTIVILIGGFLVYLPTPPMPVSPTAPLTAISR